MPRHPRLNAAALGILSSTRIFSCPRMMWHWIMNATTFTILPKLLFLLFFWMSRHWLFCNFFSISDVMAFCAQCCDIEATANLLNSVNVIASSAQCIGIQSIFLILYSFWVMSVFFRFQCLSYHLQHKIPRKSVQNANNANKIVITVSRYDLEDYQK